MYLFRTLIHKFTILTNTFTNTLQTHYNTLQNFTKLYKLYKTLQTLQQFANFTKLHKTLQTDTTLYKIVKKTTPDNFSLAKDDPIKVSYNHGLKQVLSEKNTRRFDFKGYGSWKDFSINEL